MQKARGEEGLDLLDIGIAIFDRERRLSYCNPAFRTLRGYPADLCAAGAGLDELLRFNAERGDFGPGDPAAQVAERLAEIDASGERELEREMADGQILRIRYRRMEDSGGLLVTFQDCTAERRAERALRESEQRYAMVSDAAEEAIYDWRIDEGRFIASPRLQAMLGRETDPGGARGWDWEDVVHPDDRTRYAETLERHLSGAEPRWSCEYRLKDAAGAWRWVSDHGTSVRNPDGRATRMVAAVRDITERIEREAALATSEERYALVTRATSDGIYDWTLARDTLFLSDNLRRFLGFGDEAWTSVMWGERVHEDDLPGYLEAIRAHFKGLTEALEVDYRLRAADGEFRWVHDRAVGQRGGDGRVVRLVGAVTDITEKMKQQAALEASEARNAAITRAMSDWLFELDVATGVIEISPHMQEFYGLDSRLTTAEKWMEWTHPDDRHILPEANRHAYRGETETVECEYRVMNGAGDYVWIRHLGVLERDDNRRVTRQIGTCRDVSDIKAIEAESEQTQARLLASMSTIADGVLLVDPADRVALFNERYVEIFSDAAGGADLSAVVVEGRDFFDMIRDGYNLGMFKPHPDGVDAWIANRRQAWETDSTAWELELASGSWILLNERRMPDGGRVSVYTDITEFKRREAEALAARERFEEAIEAISSGFALWDADDRLVVGNSRYREYFAELADKVTPGTRFSDIIRAGVDRGLFPLAEGDVQGYLDNITDKRLRASGEPREQFVNGLWLQITDHRTRDGGIVSIYTDVTELKTKQMEIERQSEILQLTLENMGQGITLVDKELRAIAMNQKFIELMEFPPEFFKVGFTQEEAFRYNAERGEYGPGDVEEQVRQRLELASKFEAHRFQRTRPDGTVIEIVGNPIEGGGMVATYTDITERKRADEALQAALAEFNAVLDHIDYGVLFMGPDLKTRIANRAFGELWGIPKAFIDQKHSMRELIEYNRYTGVYDVADEDWDDWVAARVEAISAGSISPGEFRRKDGKVLSYQSVALPDGGRMLTYFDITELKDREVALEEALAEFNALLENIDYGILFYDGDLRARIGNRAYREMWDQPLAFLNTNPTFRELAEYNRPKGFYDVADEDWDAWLDARVAAIEAADLPAQELHRKDGKVLSFKVVALPDGGRMLTYFDITELKQAEQLARDSEVRLRGILENSPIGVAVIDDDDTIHFHNAQFAVILRGPGRDLVGEKSTQFRTDQLDIEDWQRRFAEDGRVVRREMRYRALDGSEVWSQTTYERANWQGVPARLTWIYDVTEEKANREALVVARDEAEAALADLRKAQERLIQSEKMASLGQLTAGIAHEIKNPLNFVNNFAKLSEEMLGELGEILADPIAALDAVDREDAEDLMQTVRENLHKINEHGRRADSIVKNMLLHSREGPSERQTVAINPIAEEALNLAYHGARAEDPSFNIEIVKSVDAGVGAVDCFPQDLMRVFLNLITNGMYAATKRATAEGDGFSPTIALTTRANGETVEIEVRDNGAGIPKDVQEKIFLPFFTTKPAGEGTGLGLSLSYDIIVKQHSGTLTVDSVPGDHTAFIVALPRSMSASKEMNT